MRLRGSIRGRMLTSSLLILCAFLGLAALALDAANRHRMRSAIESQLQTSIYTLLAAADEDDAGRMRLPAAMAAPDFNRPDSGTYAQVRGEDGAYSWRSGSLLGRTPYPMDIQAVGTTRTRDLPGLYSIEQGIAWEDLSGNAQRYTLGVALDAAPYRLAQQAFRRTLWLWLGGGALALLLAQFFLVRWGLAPLQDMARKVGRIERGEADSVDGNVPRELTGLAQSLNSLIQQHHKRQERVRNSLADLAHSMKTPLAVLRGACTGADGELAGLIAEQTGRIDEIVGYQRQRAAVAGHSAVNRPIALHPVVERFCAGLRKVHRDRDIACRNLVDPTMRVRIDEGDLFELLGNLMENAFKHARSVVEIRAERVQGDALIHVEDDGEGIPEEAVPRLLRRGERADQRHPGQGIGLAVVHEIVQQYDGRLDVGRSTIGGARFSARLH